MKHGIEIMISIILITFMAVLGTSYIIVSLNTEQAQNYHAGVITQLENADFSQSVIDDCLQKAKENGYDDMTIEVLSSMDGKKLA